MCWGKISWNGPDCASSVLLNFTSSTLTKVVVRQEYAEEVLSKNWLAVYAIENTIVGRVLPVVVSVPVVSCEHHLSVLRAHEEVRSWTKDHLQCSGRRSWEQREHQQRKQRSDTAKTEGGWAALGRRIVKEGEHSFGQIRAGVCPGWFFDRDARIYPETHRPHVCFRNPRKCMGWACLPREVCVWRAVAYVQKKRSQPREDTNNTQLRRNSPRCGSRLEVHVLSTNWWWCQVIKLPWLKWFVLYIGICNKHCRRKNSEPRETKFWLIVIEITYVK